MGKRRRHRNRDAWWCQQYGGMPVWGLAAAAVVIISLGITVATTQIGPATADPERTMRPVTPLSNPRPTPPSIAGPEAAEVRHDFSGTDDVPGTPFSWTRNQAVGTAPVIDGGLFVNTATAATSAATYLEAETRENVTRVGADFSFTTDDPSAPSGAVMIGAWSNSIVASYPTIPNSPAHFVVTQDGWIYGTWNADSGENEIIRSGDFKQPLLADGTVYTAEVQLDGGRATLFLPDGSTATVRDARIDLRSGPFASWELYQNNASTDSRPGFVEVWGDSSPPS